jgi:hypothetical protein
MTDRCSEKGCGALAVSRFIDPESAEHPERPGTERPVCRRDFWKRVDLEVRQELLARMRARRAKK